MAINISGVVKTIKRVNVYTPLIEAIVNSLDSIEESGRDDGCITIRLFRDNQKHLPENDDDSSLSPIVTIEVEDNGIGFTEDNIKAFDTLYTDAKISKGGQGFGRFTFIKFFKKVSYTSIFKANHLLTERKFNFGRKNEIIIDHELNNSNEIDTKTILRLEEIVESHRYILDKRVDTIARKLVENLLIIFIDENYKCPQIVLEDTLTQERVVLNNFFTDKDYICNLGGKDFKLKNKQEENTFIVKVFKIYYPSSQVSSVILSAHNREVMSTPLHNYIPEFKDEFYDKSENEDGQIVNKNYIIRTYVLSKYLDKNVSGERSGFDIPKKEADMFYDVTQEDIEREAAKITAEYFKEDVSSRQEKKKNRVMNFIKEKAPWHLSYIKYLDLTKLDYDANDEQINTALSRLEFEKQESVRKQVKEILESNKDFQGKVDQIINDLTEINKSNLVQYVVIRKNVLDLFSKSLELKEDDKYSLENIIHNIIFPVKSDSENTSYDEHNLWLIDERLSFHEYLASDQPLQDTQDRPDILIFNKSILLRENNEVSNPIFVFEFKRPQRDDYDEDDDPIKQISRYVEQIRKGNRKNVKGRDIPANEKTPAYGFVICDLTSKIKQFCKDAQLTESPDQRAFFGYHTGYQIYFEVISFDKLAIDAELRNRIFFKKLGID